MAKPKANWVCLYCKQTLARHKKSKAGVPGGGLWVDCPEPDDRAVPVSGVYFRPPGPTMKCKQCGHEQLIPKPERKKKT